MRKPERRTMLIRATITLLLTITLPLAGVILSGGSITPYFEISPEAQDRDYPGVFWPAVAGLWVFFFLLVAAWLLRAQNGSVRNPTAIAGKFPYWGWIGLGLVAFYWFAAWSPASPEWLRRFSFPPLWLGFAITVNALLYRRTSRCPLTHETKFFLTLFPASAAFWWLFEYLNRFVDNWGYLGADEMGTSSYLVHASFSFATVLPAVYSVREWLGSFPGLQARLRAGPLLRHPVTKRFGWLVLIGFALAMTAIGIVPELFFPALWVGPLGVWIGLELIQDRRHPWPEIQQGDWRAFLSWALAALICGFFWELWNFYALPKWEYQIPWFETLYLFEMPLSGYLGYLPFGLECAIVVTLLGKLYSRKIV